MNASLLAVIISLCFLTHALAEPAVGYRSGNGMTKHYFRGAEAVCTVRLVFVPFPYPDGHGLREYVIVDIYHHGKPAATVNLTNKTYLRHVPAGSLSIGIESAGASTTVTWSDKDGLLEQLECTNRSWRLADAADRQAAHPNVKPEAGNPDEGREGPAPLGVEPAAIVPELAAVQKQMRRNDD